MQNPQAVFDQALRLHQSGRVEEAIRLYLQLLPGNPANPQLVFLLGTAYLQIDQFEQGLVYLDQLLAAHPDHVELLTNRGIALKELKRYQEAIASLNKAISLQPDFAQAYNNRGNAHKELQQLEQALNDYDQALALDKNYADAHLNRAVVLNLLRRPQEALVNLDEVIRLDPQDAEAWWNKSLFLILAGEYLQGWKLYEWRFKTQSLKHHYHQYAQPRWDGTQSLAGKKILAYTEQGLGDTIQFCRYVPMLHALGAEVIFKAQQPLLGVLSTLPCPVTLLAADVANSAFDYHIPLMSLPMAFGTTVDTIPADIPYLSSQQDKVDTWQSKLSSSTKLKVGLVWSGSSKHKFDSYRSIALEALIPLQDLPVEFYSLQKEYRPHDEQALKHWPALQQHQHSLVDFTDTAALIQCMDLVISVDTSVAHMAGAMGKPVWIILPFMPDYRWMLDREDTPWYPDTARLFRQQQRGNWAGVIEQVKQALQERLGW